MNKYKKESFFWTSYSDLMTSLFFVMLVLFVLVIILLQIKIKEQEGQIKVQTGLIRLLERITQIDKQFEPLINSGTFQYYPKSKKFVAKDLIGHEIFNPNQTVILPQFRDKTITVGREVEKLLKALSKENPDFSYQLVIEGNMANKWDMSLNKDRDDGYKISYERALAVYQLWRNDSIDLRKYNTEILICGSGFNGEDRDNIEENNKRFSIQIIPKISSRNNLEKK